MTAADRGSCRGFLPDPAAKTVAAILTNAAHGVPVLNEITGPFYEAAGAKPFVAEADDLAKLATDAPVNPHPYVGEYQSVALAFRVIPQDEGIALRVRPKVLFYDGDTLEESRAVPLRPIRDGHFITSSVGRASSPSSIQAPTDECNTWSLGDACTDGARDRC